MIALFKVSSFEALVDIEIYILFFSCRIQRLAKGGGTCLKKKKKKKKAKPKIAPVLILVWILSFNSIFFFFNS